jgi:hypothetical protein
MKYLFLLLTCISFTWAQTSSEVKVQKEEDYPVTSFISVEEQDHSKIDLSDEQIKIMALRSREHLKLMLKDPDELKYYSLVDYKILLPKTTLFPPTKQSSQAIWGMRQIQKPSFECEFDGQNLKSEPLTLSKQTNDIISKLENQKIQEKKFNPGQIYFIWGYNRAWHSKSDATFTTPEGTFTIKDAHGNDRPSTDFKDYVKPSHFLIPQYNYRMGYQLTPKWSIEAGMDHMKWVFDENRKYQVEGNYSNTVFVRDPNDPHNLFGLNFDQVKASGDMSWLKFEHTDGYNYAFVAGVYKQNLYTTRNEKFKIDALGGAGLGPVIPKTKVIMHQNGWWNFDGLDNKFHIAGMGGHAEGKLRLTYGRVFAEGAARFTYIKINDALVDGTDSRRLEQTPISSLEIIGAVGVTINSKKKKKIPKLD